MNATEDGIEPMGEAPDVAPQAQDPNRFAQQAIPFVFEGQRRTVWVPAQATECPQLVITPAVTHRGDGALRFRGTLALTHTRTGCRLVHSTYVAGLEKLAGALKELDWAFDDRDHFAKPENAEMVAAARDIIRTWQLDGGYSGPVSLWGDDEDKKAARNAAPALTLLREDLEWWPKHRKAIDEADFFNTNKEAWQSALACSVQSYSVTYLLAVLMRVDPQAADVAARQLTRELDAGDQLGEWMFQWARELDAGEPLTLHGIPAADPLAEFGASA